MEHSASGCTRCPHPCQVTVAQAIARLRGDVERFRADRPAVAYALLSETHQAIMGDWRAAGGKVPADDLAHWLECLLEAATALMHRLHVEAVSPPTAADSGAGERGRLAAQADMVLEEVRRIEAELAVLRPARLAA